MKQNLKRLCSYLLVLSMLLSVLPFGAFAASDPDSYVFDISEGTIQVLDGDTAGKIKVNYGDGLTTEEFDPSQVITVTGTASGKSLAIDTATPVTIKASNLTIDNAYVNYVSPMLLGNDAANVTLVLEGENLFVGGRDQAGIVVETGRTLTITGTGSLEARGEDHSIASQSCGAGIGGRVNESCGTVIIESGTVTAIGGYCAAGIGGGGKYGAGSTTGNGGNVTINGGTVTATGNDGAADIGGGCDTANTGTLTVDGNAWVTAANIGAIPTLTKGVVNGTVYGDITLTEDRTVDNLTIAAGAKLTVSKDVTLTVNSKLTNNGSLYIYGPDSITGSGTIAGSNRTAYSRTPAISVNTDLVETGEVLDPQAKATGFTVLGVAAWICEDSSIGSYTKNPATAWGAPTYSPAPVKDAGEYTVSFTNGDVTVSKTFTVDCELDFVEGEMGDTKRVTYNTVLGEVPASEKEGYTFDGWFTEDDVEYDPTAPVTRSATYYARYTPNVYKITYGDETMDVTFDAPFTVPAAPALTDGEVFYAWLGSDGNIYLAGETYTYTYPDHLTLTALIDRDTDTDTTYWTVKFIGEDGYLYRVELVEQKSDATVTLPIYAPYADATWMLGNSDAVEEYNAESVVPVTGDTIFTVKVPAQYTVTFKANGYQVAQYTVRDGETLPTVPAVPEVYGYYGKWSPAVTTATVVTQDMTVTAEYKAVTCYIQYRLTEDLTTTVTSQAVDFNKYFTPVAYTWDVPDGQSFLAWRGKDGNLYVPGLYYLMKNTNPLVVTPLFENNSEYWTVKFIGENGYLYDVALVEKTSDATVTLPTYAEYPAATWMLANDEYGAGSVVPITGDTTFTVKAPALFTVTFKANGYQVAQYTVRDGETLEEIPAVPETYGYYGKWDTDLTQPITGDLTVTAEYKAVTCYIQYRLTEAQETTVSVQPVDFGRYFRPIDYTWDVPDGQSFLAWRGKDGNLYVPGLSYLMKNTNPLVVTPLFENNTEYWTVKFMGENGYLYDVALVEKTSDATVTLPTYAEYPAATWVLDGTEYNADDTVDITGDTTFTVKAPALYTVTFMANGYQVAQYTVRDGETLPEVPAVPEKYGYTGQWDADTDAAITEDTVIEAAYTANEYTIYYHDETGAVYYEEDVTFGDWFTPVAFEGTVPDGMKFLGWNGDDGQFFLAGVPQRLSVASNLDLLPVFDSDTEYWTVKFCHPDGSLENVYLVEQAAINGTEFFIADKEYSLYPDAEWMLTSGDVDEVAVGELVSTNYITIRSDVVFTAVVPETYTILFYSEEGYLMDARFIMANELIGAGPVAPAKEGYTFVGWQDENGELLDDTTVATQDAVYTPVYEKNLYPIILVPSEHVQLGVLPESAQAGIGDIITIGTAAEAGFETYYVCVYYQNEAGMVPVAISPLPGNAPYDTPDMNGYTFVMPAGPVMVQVVEQANRNTAQFIVDNDLYALEYILSGETPTAPAEPVKEGYTFIGWEASDGIVYTDAFAALYADETYNAVFEINSYDLTYYRGAEADASEFKCILALPDGTFVEFFNNDTLNMPTYVVADVTYGTTVELAEPALPGYVFKGWVDEDGYMHPAGAKYTMPARDVLLTAVWEEDTELSCLVRFINNGELYDAYLAYDGQDASIPAVDPTADGKIFKGWKHGENTYSNTGVKDFTVVASDAREMTFEAVWEDILYTVTYTDYETFTDIAYGTELVTLAAPEQEGYTFVAWQCAENGAYYLANTAFTVKGNMTFTAVWAKNDVEYTVKFFDENGNLVDLFVAEDGADLTAPVYEQGREDAEYLWVDAEHNTYLHEGESFTATADCSYRATLIDEAQYPILIIVESDDGELDNVATADKNEYLLGETVYVDITVPEGYVLKRVSAAGINGELLPLKDSLLPMGGEDYLYIFEMPAAPVVVLVELEKIPAGYTAVKFVNDGDLYDYVMVERGTNGVSPETAPSKPGYTFVEWRCDELNSVVGINAEFSVPTDAADVIEYYAVWEANDYMVEYRPDGGTPDPDDVHGLHYGEKITLADAPTRDGFVFIGWVEEATGFIYSAGATYTVTDSAVFTAKWEAAEYVVRFIDPDTGIIYGYEPVTEGKQVTAPAAPVASGKTFLYWENKDNAADQVNAGSLTPNILTDTTYYARYEVSTHSITVVTEQCSVNLNFSGAVPVGTAVQFTATANSDYAMDSVVLTYTDGLSPVVRELHPDASGVYTFVMPDADVTITAKAVQNVFSIFTVTDGNTNVTVLNGNKGTVGETVLYIAEPTSADYVLETTFVATVGGTLIPVTRLVDGYYAFTMPAEDVAIYASSVKAEYTVTYLDDDNTLLGIVPVNSGEYATAPVAVKEGYTFDHWQILPLTDPEVDFDPLTDEVTENLVVRAVYVGDTHTVAAGLIDNVAVLRAECTISSGNVNSSDLLQTALNAETGKTVYFTVAAEYDWVVTDIAVVSAEGTDLVVEPTLREKKTVDGLVYYTYSFTMPAEDVKIDVYTVEKRFPVYVEENIGFAGEYTINGFYTNNLLCAQGSTVTIDIAPIEGYEVAEVYGEFVDKNSVLSRVDGVANADNTQFTFPMVPYEVTVYIVYAPIAYSVDVQTSNFETYKPDASQNPAAVVESLDSELTSQGKITIEGVEDMDYTNALMQVYKIPANGEAIVGQRVCFTVEEYTGYDLVSVTVTYDNGEQHCPLTIKDGKYYFDMPADDVVITAEFTEEIHTVKKDAASEAHGQVEMNGLIENSISVAYKDGVEVVVTPDAGYQVTKIYYVLADGSVKDFDMDSYENLTTMADALDTAHSIFFHMPATTVTVYVEYAPIDYTISVVKEEAEVTGQPDTANVGEQITFTTEAHYGYLITKVYVIDETSGAYVDIFTDSTNTVYGADYRFTMPASAVTIHVETIKDTYNVIYLDNGDFVAGEKIDYLDTANVSAYISAVHDADPGYHFVGWTSAETQTPVVTPSIDDSDFVIVKDTFIRAAYEKDEIDVLFTATVNGTVTEKSTGNTAEYRLDTTVFGDKVEFTAVPDVGYVIDTISITTTDGDGYTMELSYRLVDGVYSFIIPATFKASVHDIQAEDVVVTVTFKKDTFTLTKAADCETEGSISVNGSVATETSFEYLYQDAVTITATPNPGYYVASITASSADGSEKFEIFGTKPAVDTLAGDALTLSFLMPACDLTYTVDYEKNDYSITCVYNPDHGKAETAPADIAQIDDIVTITVTPQPGYELVELTVTYEGGEKSCELTKIAENVYTFTMPTYGVTVTALFDEITYTANLVVNGEATTALNGYDTDNYPVDYLDTCTVSVTPDAGWKLVSVVVNDGAVKVNEEIDPNGGDYTFTMPHEDVTVVVTLEKIDYTVTCVYDAKQGKAEAVETAQVGDIVTVTVTPQPGYELAQLTATYADGEKSCVLTEIMENVYTFTMPAADVTVTAVFTEVTYTANLVVVGKATTALNGYDSTNVPADYLDTVTVTITPDAGWQLVSLVINDGAVKVNEEIKPEGGNYTFTMPDEDVTIVATLEKTGYDVNAYALNFYEIGHGTVSLTPEKIAYVGDNIIITADPDDGYRVKSVVVEDTLGYAVPVSFISGEPGYVETWSFTMPAAAVDIYVTFEVQGASYYDDVRTDHWFYEAVTFVTDRGYFLGVAENLFGPEINMDRAMFVTALGRISRVDTSLYTGKSFSDVEVGSYYAPYVAWAAENGIVLGRTPEIFDPDADISREEMAAVMYRYCEYLGVDMTLKNQVFMDRYEDAGDISPWAEEYVKWAVGVGLIRGMSPTTIDPLSYATRAQVAQVIKNLCDKVLYR